MESDCNPAWPGRARRAGMAGASAPLRIAFVILLLGMIYLAGIAAAGHFEPLLHPDFGYRHHINHFHWADTAAMLVTTLILAPWAVFLLADSSRLERTLAAMGRGRQGSAMPQTAAGAALASLFMFLIAIIGALLLSISMCGRTDLPCDASLTAAAVLVPASYFGVSLARVRAQARGWDGPALAGATWLRAAAIILLLGLATVTGATLVQLSADFDPGAMSDSVRTVYAVFLTLLVSSTAVASWTVLLLARMRRFWGMLDRLGGRNGGPAPADVAYAALSAVTFAAAATMMFLVLFGWLS